MAKVQATEEYLLKADHIFIVARIERAVSDQTVNESLLSALSRHIPNALDEKGVGALNVTMVCTHAEPSHV